MKTIDVSKTPEVISFLSKEMDASREELAHLDSLTGDGDMGVTVTLIFRSMKKTASRLEGMDCAEALTELGEQVGETAPSTFGTLTASMLKAMGETVGRTGVFDAASFSDGLAAAAGAVMRRGGAKPGDKTLLDALCPAAEAAKRAAWAGGDLNAAARAAANAAKEGAESTASMKAVTGRAGYMGERTVGSRDSGAEAVYRMLAAFDKYLTEA